MGTNEKRIILSDTSTFTNDEAIFMEYHDVLKCPWFVFLSLVYNNGIMSEIFDISSLSHYTLEELYEWYINRDCRNVLKNLPLQPGVRESLDRDSGGKANINEWLDNILNFELEEIPMCVNSNSDLNFMKAANYIAYTKNLVNKIYVYTEEYNRVIEKDIEDIFKGKAIYVHGDFRETLTKANLTNNTTFVFSDVTKIPVLKELNMLEYSSITLVEKYGYNYDDDNEYLYDIYAMMEDTCFKFNSVENLYSNIDDSFMVNFGNNW